MANQNLPNTPQPSDEIDLGQLFLWIGNGFKKLFEVFLRMFLYLKRNSWKLLGLIVIGLVAGIGLNKIVTKKHKTEVLVIPNLESKDYLYGVITEIEANIKGKDTVFFKKIGIEIESMKGYKIGIEPLKNKDSKTLSEDIEYIELLQNFENSGLVADVLRAEILKKSSLGHKITFSYKNVEKGHENAKKLIEYINSNKYYGELNEMFKNNAQNRIEKNNEQVKQIDELISNFSKKIKTESSYSEGKIVLDNSEKLDITGLITQKNDLIRDVESRKVQILKQEKVVSIINFGSPQEVMKSFFGKNIVLIPFVLMSFFFLFSFLKYLNKKASEI